MSGGSGWQESAAASGALLRKRSEALSSVDILLRSGSGSSLVQTPSRVPRRSISRLSRRAASLLVLSKKGSSFAISRISFCESNHSSSSFQRRDVGVGSQTKSKQSRGRRPPKIQLPGRVAVDQAKAQEIIQDCSGLQPQYLPSPWFWKPLLFGGTRL